MAKARIFDLPETKGAFQLKGIVTGTEKDNFFKEKQTRTNKDMRTVNFGLTYDDKQTLYINLQGIEQEKVYFSKKAEKKGEKSDTVPVPWEERFSYNREGYRLIGKSLGVKKKVDKDGKTVNDKKTLTDFDACKEINDNLKDGASVFIRGALEYSSYKDDNGNKRVSTKLVPGQISLCSDVNFDDEKYEKQNDFNQVIIFMGIDKEKDDDGKESGRFVVAAKIVTYSTIEDVEFIITDSKLAQMFRKNLKAYYAIKVSGHMVSSTQTETVKDDDVWGEEDDMEKVNAPNKREFIITGAKGTTIDKELYSQEKIEEALLKITKANKADDDFGGDTTSGEWGNASDLDSADDDGDEPW